MFLKNNKVLFGILLAITAVYILWSHRALVMGAVPWLMLGMALLLLYYSKRKTWALIFGAFLSGLSVLSALQDAGIKALTFPQVFFFFIPGAIFMSLYLTKNMHGLLLPASLLLWSGFGLFLKGVLRISGGSVLTTCVGTALITVYLLSSRKNSHGYLTSGLLICAFGLCSFLKQYFSFSYKDIGWTLVAVLVFAVFIKSRKGKTDGDDFN